MTTKVYSLNLEKKAPFGFEEDGVLHYGYGCFETLSVFENRPVLASAHLERFHRAADFLKIKFPFSDDSILNHAQTLCEGCQRGSLKWILTAGDRLPNFKFNSPKLMMILTPMASSIPSEINVKVIEDPFPRSIWDSYKTLNYAKSIWHKQGLSPHEDLVFLDPDGALLEATTSNLFLVKGNDLLTPEHPYILQGITRRWMIDQAHEFGFKTSVKSLRLSDYEHADAAFLTNAAGVTWIKQKPVSLEVKARLENCLIARHHV